MSAGTGLNTVVILALLVIIAVVAALTRYIRVPYSVALVLTGLALALVPNSPHVSLTPELILTIFLPVLLFFGAYNLNLADLRANFLPVTLLAVPGVIATAGIVGGALYYLTGLDLTTSLLFGTMVAATDPVAVLAVFGEVGAPRRLATIVTGESLFNDGTALVFFATVLGVATTSHFDLGTTVEQFFIEALGALVLGVAVGVLGSVVLRGINDALLETMITLIMAYGGYLLATSLGVSGPIETVTAGIFLGSIGEQVMSAATRSQARATWEFLDFLANSLLFLLVGLQLRPIGAAAAHNLGTEVWLPFVVGIAAVVISRAVVVVVVSGVLQGLRQGIPRRWRVALTWSGLRGAVSLAAALSLPMGLPNRDLLLALTFGVVLFTLLGQGMTIRPLLERLHMAGSNASRRGLEVLLGRMFAASAAVESLDMSVVNGTVDDAEAQRLKAHIVIEQAALRQELNAAYGNPKVRERQSEREAERRMLWSQREALQDALRRGMISEATLRELLGEVDKELAALEPTVDEEL